MTIALLIAGHLLGDWIIQTDRQAHGKTQADGWLRPMLAHLVTYHLTLAVFLVWILPPVHLLILLAVSAVTHGIIDRRWTVAWLLRRTGSPQFAEQLWGVMVADQALHLSILLLTLVALTA